METNKDQVGWEFLFKWVLATVLGFILFFILKTILSYWFYIYILFFFGFIVLFPGLLLGVGQSLVLRRYVEWHRKWERASIFIYGYSFIRTLALLLIIGFGINIYTPLQVWSFNSENIVVFFLPGAIYGTMVALDFRDMLKEKIRLSYWWVAGNSASWAICLIPIIALYLQINNSAYWNVSAFAIIILGIIVGLAQGIPLMFNMNHNQIDIIVEPTLLYTESP